MPHILIEYSSNVAAHHDIDALVDAVHAGGVSQQLAALGAHRTRAMERNHYRIGDGNPDYAFVAIVVRIGPGRDAPTRTALLSAVLDAAEQHIAAQNGPLTVAWSAEVQEIDADFRINRNNVKHALAEAGE